jgi:hypothetical protein
MDGATISNQRMRFVMRRSSALMAVVCILVSPGCTSPPERSDALVLDTSLYDVLYGPTADSAINDFHAKRVALCMNDLGWEYSPVLGTNVAAFVRLGMSESEFAETYGFAITTQPPTPVAGESDVETAYVAQLTPSARRQYSNSLNDCGAQAAKDVEPVASRHAALYRSYQEEVVDRLQASSDGQRALTDWRTCVGERFAADAVDTLGLVAAVQSYLDSASLSNAEALRLEVEVATDAIRCREIRRQTESSELDRLEATFIEKNREAVVELLAFLNG